MVPRSMKYCLNEQIDHVKQSPSIGDRPAALLGPLFDEQPIPTCLGPLDSPVRPGSPNLGKLEKMGIKPDKTQTTGSRFDLLEKTATAQQEWTIVVDLIANFNERTARGKLGAEDKLQRLFDLKDETKGKPITIVVQSIEPSPPSAQQQLARIAGSNSSAVLDNRRPGIADPGAFTLRRYVIKDGRIEELPKRESKAHEDDLSNLLQFALKNYPAKRVALDFFGHGDGNAGVTGDQGDVSAAAFERSIERGLAGSGHQRLHLLDLDACLMAEDDILRRGHNVAKRLIASAETELVDRR